MANDDELSPSEWAISPIGGCMTNMSYSAETMCISVERAEQIKRDFLIEVDRLLASGGIDPEDHSRGLLFGVALENLADGFLRGERSSKAYKNLKAF